MANKFELGSSEWAIPESTNEHYTDEEFEQAQEMYSANAYDEGVTPDQYVSKKEVSKDAERMISEFKSKKIGKGTFEILKNLAA